MARPIMIQGTTSNAGKSLLCAALCMYAYGRLQGKLDAMEKDRDLME